ncbi:hypothetical protein ACFWO5_06995, partial [Rhodococcus sp. NPDC058481]
AANEQAAADAAAAAQAAAVEEAAPPLDLTPPRIDDSGVVAQLPIGGGITPLGGIGFPGF